MDDYEFHFIDKNEFKGIVQKVLDRRRKEKEEEILKEFETCNINIEADVNHVREEIVVEPLEIETYRQSSVDHINLDEVEHPDSNNCIVWKASSDRTEFSAKSKSGLRIPFGDGIPGQYRDDMLVEHNSDDELDSRNGELDLQTAFDKGYMGDHRVEFVDRKDQKRPENKIPMKKVSPAPNYPNVGMLFIRITSFQKLITSAIDQIMPKLLERKFFDGPRDFEKRQKRYLAFINLLSRNYLYRIERIISDIESTELEEVTEKQAIGLIMKICTLYNIIEFSLQAFLKNLVNYVDNGVPEKMPIFLKLIRNATEMCIEKGFFDHDDNIAKGLVDKTRLILQKLNEFDKATRTKRKALRARYELEHRLERTLSISTLNAKSKSNLSMYAETVGSQKRSGSKQKRKPSIISTLRQKLTQKPKKNAPASKQEETKGMTKDQNIAVTPKTLERNQKKFKEDEKSDDILLTLRLDYVQSTVEKEQMRLKYEKQCEKLSENQTNNILSEFVTAFKRMEI